MAPARLFDPLLWTVDDRWADFANRAREGAVRFEFELQRSGGYRYGASLRFFMALFRRAASSVWRHDDRSAVEQKRFWCATDFRLSHIYGPRCFIGSRQRSRFP